VFLTPGARISSYEITALIGVGGMGEVYRARDMKLERLVAIKTLPESFAHDSERLARFQREAKTLAALNHPNIAIIHGVEESDAIRALVMELVEGPTLADRIAQGPIPIDEALPIARQVAEALEAAHEQSIIHRDLKPSNIKLRPDGVVKVLDFGLAKSLDPSPGTIDASQSPTITSPAMTQAGVILGTAAYMSPEQARGKVVDKRADIWAFGCVLYEMVTGRRAFAGDEVADTLAKVLETQPDWLALEAAVPLRVRELLHQCLEKDARRRLRDIGDALADLQNVATTSAEYRTTGAPPHPSVRPWRVAAAGLTILSLGLAAGGLVVWRITGQRDVGVLRFDITARGIETGLAASVGGNLAISPRGLEIVFGGLGVRVRSLDRLGVRSLAGPNSQQPFMSPDGEWVAFLEGTTLKKVRVTGGPVLTIASAGGTALEGASWGVDDTIVFTTNNASGLLRVSATGGEPKPLTSVSARDGEVEHRWPEILPSGRAVLFTISRGGSGVEGDQIAVLDLASGDRRVVVPRGGQARYMRTGHLVYGMDGVLWAVPFDANRFVTNGSPIQVLAGVHTTPRGGAEFAVAQDGSLVYISGGALVERRRLAWVDRQGREHPINAPIRAYAQARISPDGRRLVLDVRDQGEDIWVWDLASETFSRVTLDPGFDRQPIWAPDSRRIAFYSNRGGTNSLLMVSADGTGVVERLTERPASAAYPTSFSPNGKQLLMWEAIVNRGIDLQILDLDDPQRGVRSLLSTEVDERNAEVSPDGRWIAYQANESGQYEVYVRPFPMVETGRWPISNGGGTRPMWAPDGRELFYYADALQRLMVVPVTTSGTMFTRGAAKVLFEETPLVPILSRTFDISPDGQRFLLIKEAGVVGDASDARRIVFVQKWFEELKRLVPTK
jgi:serine/threonine-protein kinase